MCESGAAPLRESVAREDTTRPRQRWGDTPCDAGTLPLLSPRAPPPVSPSILSVSEWPRAAGSGAVRRDASASAAERARAGATTPSTPRSPASPSRRPRARTHVAVRVSLLAAVAHACMPASRRERAARWPAAGRLRGDSTGTAPWERSWSGTRPRTYSSAALGVHSALASRPHPPLCRTLPAGGFPASEARATGGGAGLVQEWPRTSGGHSALCLVPLMRPGWSMHPAANGRHLQTPSDETTCRAPEMPAAVA